MDVMEKTAGLDYEAEYNRLKEKMSKQNEENTYLRAELKNKEGELLYYQGFKAAFELIFGRRYEHGCYGKAGGDFEETDISARISRPDRSRCGLSA